MTLTRRDRAAAVLAVAVRIDGTGFEFVPTTLTRAWARALREACG